MLIISYMYLFSTATEMLSRWINSLILIFSMDQREIVALVLGYSWYIGGK